MIMISLVTSCKILTHSYTGDDLSDNNDVTIVVMMYTV